jgi:hypothetical protein
VHLYHRGDRGHTTTEAPVTSGDGPKPEEGRVTTPKPPPPAHTSVPGSTRRGIRGSRGKHGLAPRVRSFARCKVRQGIRERFREIVIWLPLDRADRTIKVRVGPVRGIHALAPSPQQGSPPSASGAWQFERMRS